MSTVVKGYLCWRCGTELSELRLPVSRREECSSCRAEIHVCKQCVFYSAHIANACREDRAEFVSNKEKSNFCDYYKPKADACQATALDKDKQAKLQAEALFGDIKQDKKSEQTIDPDDPEQAAREELKRLFGDDG
ncbi:MAG: hypothetical protein JXA04_10375 [Gammaproteobacteria bacterium]|nr:hypothetical protein [Gammaproteobacteria bacterium]